MQYLHNPSKLWPINLNSWEFTLFSFSFFRLWESQAGGRMCMIYVLPSMTRTGPCTWSLLSRCLEHVWSPFMILEPTNLDSGYVQLSFVFAGCGFSLYCVEEVLILHVEKTMDKRIHRCTHHICCYTFSSPFTFPTFLSDYISIWLTHINVLYHKLNYFFLFSVAVNSL
jgi:hypothetical protein